MSRILVTGAGGFVGRALLEADQVAVGEDHSDSPESAYAVSKAAQEMLVAARARLRVLKPIYVRLFNPIGPGQSEPFVVPTILRAMIQARAQGAQAVTIRLKSTQSARDFIDIRDAAVAMVALTLAPQAVGERVNVCSGVATKVADVATKLGEIAGMAVHVVESELSTVLAAAALAVHEIPFQRGRCTKLNRLTGWTASRTWVQTLEDSWNSLL